ncbi:MAG: glycosyltransferase [Spirochaeta sp.]
MPNPTVSVIIPTYNESEYLPKLLHCLEEQTFRDFEIIVADNESTDGTADVARSFGAQVVPGGMPAAGRNNGASAAAGEYLFFFDADVKFARNFLENAVQELRDRDEEVATCETVPLSNLALDRFMHQIANYYVKSNLEKNPQAPGFCIMISRRIFEAIGGFDESLSLAEDHDLVARASRHKPLVFLESVRVMVSVRRYRKEGRLDYMLKVVKVTLYRQLHGNIRDDVFEYEFGDFKHVNSSSLRKIEHQINKLDMALKKAKKRTIRPLRRRYMKVNERIAKLLSRS